jgi:ribonuclease Z
MSRYFDPQLVNGPFGDPGLYVDLVFQRRALLFDLGDISVLPPRKLLRITHIFVSHRHMDHFIGFDQLVRCLLGRDKTVGIWGPPGLIDAVACKLAAYSWNLVGNYDGNLTLRVAELASDDRLAAAEFAGANGFRRKDLPGSRCEDGVLVTDPGFRVRATMLEHGVPVLAFALEERASINIKRSQVESLGLVVGPWLRAFKDAILSGEADNAPIHVAWSEDASDRPDHLPLGHLKNHIMSVTKGRKIAYIVDAAFNDRNADAIVAIAAFADMAFIETTFLDAEADRAAAHNHLTARQAGQLARRAQVKQLRTFHYSPRYRGHGECLDQEAQAAALLGQETCHLTKLA